MVLLLRSLCRVHSTVQPRVVAGLAFGGGVALTLTTPEGRATACEANVPALLGTAAAGFGLAWMVKPSDSLQGYAEARMTEANKRAVVIKQQLAAGDPAAVKKITYNLDRSTFLFKQGSAPATDLQLKEKIFYFILGALSDPMTTMDFSTGTKGKGAPVGVGCLDVNMIKATKKLLLAPMSEDDKAWSLEYMSVANPDSSVHKLAYTFARQIVHNIDIFDADLNGEIQPARAHIQVFVTSACVHM